MGFALATVAALMAPGALAQERPAQKPGTAAAVEGELARLADEVGPSVVGVVAGAGSERRRGDPHEAAGAGVVVSSEGLVLTSAAVVPENVERIGVVFPGGRRASAREVRRDGRTGLVVLQVEGTGLRAATLAEARGARRGAIVATFGNPFGTISKDGTPAMSLGMLSGIDGATLETDAAVNPGSFGGPLVDARGRVIGIVVPEFRNERWLGLARAIDARVLSLVQGTLKADEGLVADDDKGSGDRPAEGRGVVGIKVYEDSDDPAKIETVMPGSPADRAKLKPGDVVVSVNGKAVGSGREFAKTIRAANVRAGDKVTIRVSRDGFEKDFTLKADPHPEAEAPAKPYLGLFAVNADKGLLVDEVVAGGPADRAGLRKGDLLRSAGGTKLGRTEDLGKALHGKKPGDELAVVLSREMDGEWWERKATIKLGKKPGEKAEAPKTEGPRGETPKGEHAAKKPGFLGVKLENAQGGVRIAEVIAGTPADKGGLKAGDVIVSVAGEKADSIESFTKGLQRFGAGDRVELMVSRGDDWKRPVEVTLGEKGARAPAPPTPPTPPAPPAPPKAEAKPGFLGVKVEPVQGGLRIVEVVKDSPAEQAGVKAGAVIVEINGQKADSIDAFRAALSPRKEGEKVTLALQDGSKVEVTLGKRP